MTVEQMTALIAEAELNEARRTAHVRSRIYGYDFDSDGSIIINKVEAEVISTVIEQLATITFLSCSKLLDDIAREFRLANPQVRTRSGRLWTAKTLAQLAKPIYASLELNRWGTYSRIFNYPPITTEKAMKAAITRLKRENLA